VPPDEAPGDRRAGRPYPGGREGTAGADWFDEIDLDPEGRWLRMGTRNLGERPWLVADDRRRDELALKARLSAERHDEVFAALPGSEAAGAETLALVEAGCERLRLDPGDAGPVDAGAHPLERAGRLVQEDLCLMRREPEGWILAAASLCFPSRWRLAAKLGHPMAAVHGPVEGFDPALTSRVDQLFDRLGDRIVWRRNWFVHPDAALFQPDRPTAGDPVVSAERCLDDLHLRSERQTLRRLPDTGWILFTIRIQQDPLGRFVADPDLRAALVRYLDEAPPDQLAHRGIGGDQRAELRRMLAL
jgi:dimethylamine monooxygenase subunit A